MGTPLERVAIYIAEPFPRSSTENKYSLVIITYSIIKWPEVVPIPKKDWKTVADSQVEQSLSSTGDNVEISNRNVWDLMGIKKTRTTPLNSQSGEMVERFNRTLDNHQKFTVSEHQTDWDKLS